MTVVNPTGAAPSFNALSYGANYGDFGAPFQAGGSAVDINGQVIARGLVKKSVAWANGDTIATLAAVLAPTNRQMFIGFANDLTNGIFIARLDVNPDGTIVISASSPNIATPGTLQYLSLAEIRYFK